MASGIDPSVLRNGAGGFGRQSVDLTVAEVTAAQAERERRAPVAEFPNHRALSEQWDLAAGFGVSAAGHDSEIAERRSLGALGQRFGGSFDSPIISRTDHWRPTG
jgi:hypothetical protein